MMKSVFVEPLKVVHFEPRFLLFVEKRGEFSVSAPIAWKEFHQALAKVEEGVAMGQMVGLSRVEESPLGEDGNLYQAGLMVTNPGSFPVNLFSQRVVQGGKFARFLLKGSYNQLASAYPSAFGLLESCGHVLRNDFCMEIYLNSPKEVDESQLLTEICIPIE